MTLPSKLQQLAEDWGYDNSEDLIEDYIFDSIVPGICTSPGCDYSTEYEPDQSQGWCEICSTNTVSSALVLAGVI